MALAVSCPSCQSKFSLKEEFAGKQVRCPRCQNVITVPEEEIDLAQQPIALSEDGDISTGGYHPHFHQDKFFIKQQLLRINENYDIFGENNVKLFYATRPTYALQGCAVMIFGILGVVVLVVAGLFLGKEFLGREGDGIGMIIGLILGLFIFVFVAIYFFPKRHISIYLDETKSTKLLEVIQDQKVALVHGTFTIVDPHEGPIGSLKKNYLMDMIRRQWQIFDSTGQLIARAKEDSILLSLLRRLMGPMLGLLRTNFILEWPDGDHVFGEYNRKLTLTDQYIMDLSKDRKRRFDRRLAIGMAVMLDTGERR